MIVMVPLMAVLALVGLAWLGTGVGLDVLFGVVIPYLALAAFLVGLVRRVLSWAATPVPGSATLVQPEQPESKPTGLASSHDATKFPSTSQTPARPPIRKTLSPKLRSRTGSKPTTASLLAWRLSWRARAAPSPSVP